MEFYAIEVNKVDFIKSVLAPENMVPEICDWAATCEDLFYQKEDSKLGKDIYQIASNEKRYVEHVNKIWEMINKGAKIIEF